MAVQGYQVQVGRVEGLFRCTQRGALTRVSKEEQMKGQQLGKLVTYPELLRALLTLTSQHKRLVRRCN